MDTVVKACSKCKEIKPFDSFHKNRSKAGGLSTECKSCSAAWQKSRGPRIRSDKERASSRRRARSASELARLNAMSSLRRAHNPDAQRESVRKTSAVARRELRDYYVVTQLRNSGVPRGDITPELIQMKREQLALKRAFRELTKTLETMQ